MDNTPDGTPWVPVVAIGASTGGLEQTFDLLTRLPADTGAAYVVVRHLAPSRASQPPALSAPATSLNVVAIENDMILAADRVHVLSTGHDLGITDNVLRLSERRSHEAVPAVIDRFFRALAEARGGESIGIVFSGTGSDGALGLKAIKSCGGLTMAQDPETAEYDGTSRAAAGTSALDFVRDTASLIEPLINHLRLNVARSEKHAPAHGDVASAIDHQISDSQLTAVLSLMRRRDSRSRFSGYKPQMLKRRILRRMGLAGLREIEPYIERLAAQRDERARLSRDFLINVTDFFREPDIYEPLQARALRVLLKDRSVEQPLRIWTPGCATGEEAYSIAIVVAEAIAASGEDHGYTIFASDIDTTALEVARNGLYPESISNDVSDTRLRAFFDKFDDQYQINHQVRERIVFAVQNLIEDPPYSRLDLISCRNVLIHLTAEAQRQVIATFHFALKPDGFLFLGRAESLAGQHDLFEPVAENSRLFRRVGASPRSWIAQIPNSAHAPPAENVASFEVTRRRDVENIARDVLLRDYVPATVLVNRQLEILCSYGPASDYFTLPFGKSSLSAIDMVREPFRGCVRTLTHRAYSEGRRQEATSTLADAYLLKISAQPLKEPAAARGLLLLVFERIARPVGNLHENTNYHDVERQLEEELQATRSDLTATIQALEASNEDLEGSNEEIMSMNEELQSTNEELETSKEKLQSLNEELTTLNGELESKVSELENAHNDLSNLFLGTQVATLFLDRTMRIKRFTPAIKDLLRLITTDIDRPLADITKKFIDPDLTADANAVMADLTVREKEVQAEDERWYLRRILPYRTRDNTIDGVVITFADISELKRAALASRASEQRLDLALNAINGGIWEIRIDPAAPDQLPDQIYLSARLKRLLGFQDHQLANSLQAWNDRITTEDRGPFSDVLRRRTEAPAEGLRYRIRHRDGTLRWFISHGYLVEDAEFGATRWIGIECDITEIKWFDGRVAQIRSQLRLLADALSQPVAYIDAEGRLVFRNAAHDQWFGSAADDDGGPIERVLGAEAYASLRGPIDTALAGKATSCKLVWRHPEQGERTLKIELLPHTDENSTAIGAYILTTDISDRARRREDQATEQARLVYIQRMATLGEMASTLAHDVSQPLSAINNYASALMRMLNAGKPSDETVPIVDKIANQVQRTNTIVEQTRSLVGRRSASDEQMDINTVVYEATSLMESSAKKASVDMRVSLHTPMPAVTGNASQIQQILVNLMGNAFDAMESVDAGQRILWVATERPDAEHIHITVRDTGEGIAPEKIHAIFDAYHSTKLEGLGMGLSISRTVAEWHGGRLWVESQFGHGASFILQLPTDRQVADAADRPRARLHS